MRSSRLILVLSTFVLTTLLIAACSEDDDPATPAPPSNAEATIGDAGGTLEIPDKLALEIPANALDTDVDFTVEENDKPAPPPEDYTFVSAVYTIEPSGTEFGDDAILTLNYKESLLGGAAEDEISILTDRGDGWEELDTDVDEENNTATADVSHLSEFVAAVETYDMPTGVYAEFEVYREFNTGTKADVYYETRDVFKAGFESGGEVSTFLQADRVTFGEWTLGWDSEDREHVYASSAQNGVLTGGQAYDFVVDGSADVPPLTQSVTVLDVEPVLTNVSWNQTLPLTGFEVTWQGATPAGNISLMLRGPDQTALPLEVPNNGAYTFSEAQLEGIAAGSGSIALDYVLPTTFITAAGYDESSHVTQATHHLVPVTFTRETVISEFNGSSTPNIPIPDGPSGGGPGAAALDVISVAATGAVDSVRVYIDANHTYASDLIIRLISPEGTELAVMWIGEGGEPETGPEGWYPGDYTPKDDLNGFDGEQVSGDWTIKAQDYSSGVAGTLVEWRLQIFYAE